MRSKGGLSPLCRGHDGKGRLVQATSVKPHMLLFRVQVDRVRACIMVNVESLDMKHAMLDPKERLQTVGSSLRPSPRLYSPPDTNIMDFNLNFV